MLCLHHCRIDAADFSTSITRKTNMPDDTEDVFPPPLTSKTVRLFPFENQHSAITLYTIFSILQRMRNDLGLEAMLEYMDFYRCLIETYNPHFKEAVGRALDLVSIEKIYTDAMRRGGKYGQDSF